MFIPKARLVITILLASSVSLSFADSACLDRPDAGSVGFSLSQQNYQPNTLKFVGANHQDLQNPWQNTLILDALRDIKPSVLRYPGGTVSTYWDHRNDKLLPDKSPGVPDGWVVADKLSSFVAGLIRDKLPGNNVIDLAFAQTQTGFKTIFTINMATPGPDYYRVLWGRVLNIDPFSTDPNNDWWLILEDRADRALDMLQRAASAGMEIEYVELGNEYYFRQDYMAYLVDKTGESYAVAANYFAKRIKEFFPNTKIAAIGTDAREDDSETRKNWNSRVVPMFDRSVIDALALHIYIDTDNERLDSYGDFLTMVRSWRNHWRNRYSRGAMHLLVRDGWDMWVTETAVNFYSRKFTNTWANNLVNAYSIAQLMENLGVEIIAMQQFTALYEEETFALTNLGVVAKTWAAATKEAEDYAWLVAESESEYRPLIIGVVFKTEFGEERYVIINLSNQNLYADISALSVRGASCTAYYAEDLTSIEPLSQTATIDSDHIAIPRLSLVLLTP